MAKAIRGDKSVDEHFDKMTDKAERILDKKTINNGLSDHCQSETESDFFNVENLRLSQNYQELIGVKKALLTIPVDKPGRQEFFRVHPDTDLCLETAIFELKEDRENYLVAPALWAELPGEIVPKILFTTINRQGVLRLWPIRLPGEDGPLDKWNKSALEAAEIAKTKWIRLASKISLGAYEVFEASGDLPEPEWPDVTFQEILKIAFKDHFINSMDHPVIGRLRGVS
jgi:hypothetical protein